MSGAVFLSYASQDAEAARRICEALRAAGVEVWFDESELRGGDAWDSKIRKQIRECALFVPIISASTQARAEGYFRLEWKLAVDRSHLLADDHPFLFPVVLGDVTDATGRVPEKFKEVQWTRLKFEETPTELAGRVARLLNGDSVKAGRPHSSPRGGKAASPLKTKSLPVWLWVVVAVIAGLVAYGVLRPRRSPEEVARLLSMTQSIIETAEKTSGEAKPVSAAPEQSEADRAIARANTLIERLDYTRDDLDAAEDLTRKATELAPESAHTWAERAWMQALYLLRGWDQSQKRLHDTEAFANRALAFDPKEPDAIYALAVLYEAQGAEAQAEAYSRRGIALRPDEPRWYRTLEGTLFRQGRNKEASAMEMNSVKRFPRDPLTQYGRALTLESNGNFAASLESLDAALAIQPYRGALLAKARILANWKGNLAEARSVFEQIAPENRTETRAVCVAMWLGLLERRLDRVQEAAALTTQTYLSDNVFLVNGPKAMTVALALYVAGKQALAQQQWQAAEAVLRQRLLDQTGDSSTPAYLATTLAWLGRTDEAARVIAPFESTAREQPALQRPIALLARYYASLGDASKAVPFIRQRLLGGKHLDVTGETLKIDPWWDKLRGQLEFETLLKKGALPDAEK